MASEGVILPRELTHGVFWLGDCGRLPLGEELPHGYNSVYLIVGELHSLVVDTSSPGHWHVVEAQLDDLLATGIPAIKYVLPTHPEIPHAGNVGRMLAKFPEVSVVGDVRDYHLILPQYADRLLPVGMGEEIDLGGRTVELVEAVFRDMSNSQWAFDTAGHVLFVSDGWSYMHFDETECGRTVEEIPEGIPVPEFLALWAGYAFAWTGWCDMEPTIQRLERLFREREVSIVAPAHGVPLFDPASTLPRVVEGLRMMGVVESEALMTSFATR